MCLSSEPRLCSWLGLTAVSLELDRLKTEHSGDAEGLNLPVLLILHGKKMTACFPLADVGE